MEFLASRPRARPLRVSLPPTHSPRLGRHHPDPLTRARPARPSLLLASLPEPAPPTASSPAFCLHSLLLRPQQLPDQSRFLSWHQGPGWTWPLPSVLLLVLTTGGPPGSAVRTRAPAISLPARLHPHNPALPALPGSTQRAPPSGPSLGPCNHGEFLLQGTPLPPGCSCTPISALFPSDSYWKCTHRSGAGSCLGYLVKTRGPRCGTGTGATFAVLGRGHF